MRIARRSRRGGARRGMSLIEVLIALALLAIVIGSIALTSDSGAGAYQEGMLRTDLESRARRLLDRVTRDVTAAGLSTLAPPFVAPWGNASLEFQVSEGWAGGAVLWSSRSRFQLVLESGELDDGLDNNGNGLVDEQRLVLVRNVGLPAEISVPIGSGVREFLEGEIENGADDNGNGLVDERGLSFDQLGDILIVRISVARRGADGNEDIRTLESRLRVRNP